MRAYMHPSIHPSKHGMQRAWALLRHLVQQLVRIVRLRANFKGDVGAIKVAAEAHGRCTVHLQRALDIAPHGLARRRREAQERDTREGRTQCAKCEVVGSKVVALRGAAVALVDDQQPQLLRVVALLQLGHQLLGLGDALGRHVQEAQPRPLAELALGHDDLDRLGREHVERLRLPRAERLRSGEELSAVRRGPVRVRASVRCGGRVPPRRRA